MKLRVFAFLALFFSSFSGFAVTQQELSYQYAQSEYSRWNTLYPSYSIDVSLLSDGRYMYCYRNGSAGACDGAYPFSGFQTGLVGCTSVQGLVPGLSTDACGNTPVVPLTCTNVITCFMPAAVIGMVAGGIKVGWSAIKNGVSKVVSRVVAVTPALIKKGLANAPAAIITEIVVAAVKEGYKYFTNADGTIDTNKVSTDGGASYHIPTDAETSAIYAHLPENLQTAIFTDSSGNLNPEVSNYFNSVTNDINDDYIAANDLSPDGTFNTSTSPTVNYSSGDTGLDSLRQDCLAGDACDQTLIRRNTTDISVNTKSIDTTAKSIDKTLTDAFTPTAGDTSTDSLDSTLKNAEDALLNDVTNKLGDNNDALKLFSGSLAIFAPLYFLIPDVSNECKAFVLPIRNLKFSSSSSQTISFDFPINLCPLIAARVILEWVIYALTALYVFNVSVDVSMAKE